MKKMDCLLQILQNLSHAWVIRGKMNEKTRHTFEKKKDSTVPLVMKIHKTLNLRMQFLHVT